MTNKIEITREQAENIIRDGSSNPEVHAAYRKARDELRALLAKPVRTVCGEGILCGDESCECKGNGYTEKPATPAVERQADAYILAKQTAVEVPGQERKELGYTLLDGIGVFHSRDEVHAAIAELSLPIGWVSMTIDQLLPGYMISDTSLPAPVAVVLPERDPNKTDAYDKGWNACLDKLKELNNLFAPPH